MVYFLRVFGRWKSIFNDNGQRRKRALEDDVMNFRNHMSYRSKIIIVIALSNYISIGNIFAEVQKFFLNLTFLCFISDVQE